MNYLALVITFIQYLAGHSEYFNTLFFGPFKESNEEVVKLQGVDRVAFVNLINLVYVHGFKVKSESLFNCLVCMQVYIPIGGEQRENSYGHGQE